MNRVTWMLCLAFVGLATRMSAQVTEDFDEPGSSWGNTVFSVEPFAIAGELTREILGVGLGAPNTTPALPINQGDDKEGRCHDGGGDNGTCVALTANLPENDLEHVALDGYATIGFPEQAGTRSFTFLVRASRPSGRIHAYAAHFMHRHTQPGVATLGLVRIRDGIIGGAGNTFATSRAFPVNFGSENFRLRLSAQGSRLSASLWRVSVVKGAVVEEPIDLLAEDGVQNTISGNDSRLSSGRVGLQGFARGANSVFFDDMTITELEPPQMSFVRGDCNSDGQVRGEVTDAVYLLNFNFLGTADPGCLAACDVNGDGQVRGEVTDAVYLLTFNFLGGPPPPAPFPSCGPGTAADEGLGCETPPTACVDGLAIRP